MNLLDCDDNTVVAVEMWERNSGGDYLLTDDDYDKLEKDGWVRHGGYDDYNTPYPAGPLRRVVLPLEQPQRAEPADIYARFRFHHATGRNSHEETCPCCGPNFSFEPMTLSEIIDLAYHK